MTSEPKCRIVPTETAPRYADCYHNPKWCSCSVCWDALNQMSAARALSGKSATATIVDDPKPRPSLPDDATKRNEYPMADGLLDYFPNALAEVSKLSFLATQQHHPDQPMHWDRSKSTDHRNKIMRHLVDTHTVDDKGIDHWAMVVWRSLAGYQTYLEEKHGLPPSRASRNLPTQ